MFHSAAVKLTTWYLAIIIAISIIFSLALYEVSSNDLDHNVNRQISYFNNLLGPDDATRYSHLRERQLNADLNHLKASLVLFNILVLVLGGAVSYWLARRTLFPIEDALDSQSRFASDASHELRTPLAAIQTENEVALRDKSLTKDRAVSVIKSNLEEIAKLKALSEGLLRLANGNGRIIVREPVSVKLIAGQAINRYTSAAAAKKIKLTNSTTAVKTCGDRDSLIELLSIFVDNAIKYSPKGSEVKLTSQRHGRQVLVRISDKGEGIKSEELPRIFERFYRTDSSRSKHSDGGYGLGLAIAKKISQAHGGHIEVTSIVGKGTTFTIFLPAA